MATQPSRDDLLDPVHATRDTDDVSLGLLFTNLADQVSTLMRREVELARVETVETISTVVRSAVSMVAGGVIAYAGLIVLLLAAAFGLANVIPLWISALVVGGVTLLIGIAMLMVGRSAIANATIVPEKTVKTVKEDIRMVKEKVE
jgi:hypothetical protein